MSKSFFSKDNIKNRKTGLAVAAVSVVGLAAASGGIAYAANRDSGTGMSYVSATQSQDGTYRSEGVTAAASDFRVSLNGLLREHVSVSLDTTRAIAGGEDQRKIDALVESQRLNAEDLAQAVGQVYGRDAQLQFDELFKEHIKESNAYAMASANGDQAGMEAAREELQEYLNDLSDFFAGAIPGLQSQDVYGLLNQHEELINKSTDAYVAGDYVQSRQMEREALKQAGQIADTLSKQIVATQPQLFQ